MKHISWENASLTIYSRQRKSTYFFYFFGILHRLRPFLLYTTPFHYGNSNFARVQIKSVSENRIKMRCKEKAEKQADRIRLSFILFRSKILNPFGPFLIRMIFPRPTRENIPWDSFRLSEHQSWSQNFNSIQFKLFICLTGKIISFYSNVRFTMFNLIVVQI